MWKGSYSFPSCKLDCKYQEVWHFFSMGIGHTRLRASVRACQSFSSAKIQEQSSSSSAREAKGVRRGSLMVVVLYE